jgi:hypothetical protein
MLHRNAAQAAEDGHWLQIRPADFSARRWNWAPTKSIVFKSLHGPSLGAAGLAKA